MITVIFPFQLFYCFFLRNAVSLTEFPNLLLEHREKLILRDAAKCVETGVVADVIRLVEAAEHADLWELSHSCEQHKLQMLVGELEHAIKTFQYLAVEVLKSLYASFDNWWGDAGVHHVEQRLVVFVNKHDNTSARLLVGFLENVCQPVAKGIGKLILAVFRLTLCHEGFNGIL